MITVGSAVVHTGYPESDRPVWIVDRIVPPAGNGRTHETAECHRADDPRFKARYWTVLLQSAE